VNTTSAPPALAQQSSRGFGAGRVLLLVFGGIAVLIALALLAGGAAAVWGLSQRDDSGYVTSGAHRLATSSYALSTDSFDVGTDAPSWVFGDHFATVRIEGNSSRPIFLGIGPADAVRGYLAGVPHDQIADLDVDPFTVDYQRETGNGRPAPPTAQNFWRVKAAGPGTQTISWPLEQGNWTVVAMNADGSSNVAVDIRLGARLPFFRWVAIGFLAGGGIVLLLGVTLIYLGARRRRPAADGV
jgi:hypothetical protein